MAGGDLCGATENRASRPGLDRRAAQRISPALPSRGNFPMSSRPRSRPAAAPRTGSEPAGPTSAAADAEGRRRGGWLDTVPFPGRFTPPGACVSSPRRARGWWSRSDRSRRRRRQRSAVLDRGGAGPYRRCRRLPGGRGPSRRRRQPGSRVATAGHRGRGCHGRAQLQVADVTARRDCLLPPPAAPRGPAPSPRLVVCGGRRHRCSTGPRGTRPRLPSPSISHPRSSALSRQSLVRPARPQPRGDGVRRGLPDPSCVRLHGHLCCAWRRART